MAADFAQRWRKQGPLVVGVIVFLVALTVGASLVLRAERRQVALHRAEVAMHALDKAHDIRSGIVHALAATHSLAALVQQGHGEVADFDSVARAMLPFFPGVAALQLAPDGVVRHVVPLAGNERIIGHDLLADPQRNVEAFLARDTGKLTLAGPFELRQGGLGAVGRLPVFLEGEHGESKFWGFVSVLMRFPGVLEAAFLDRLGKQGFSYELWRVHPDTGARQVIASSGAPLREPVEHDFAVPNGTWTLSVEPLAGWRDTVQLSLNAALTLLFSLVLGWTAKQLMHLRSHRADLQVTVAQRSAEIVARVADLDRAQAIAHIGSWALELGSRELRWSAEADRIFGVDPSVRLDYAGFLARVDPADRARVEEKWAAALGGAPYDIEHRIVVGDAVRWVRERAEIEFDARRRPVSAVGTVQDITAQKQAERELLAREAKLAALIASLPDMMFVIDAARRIVEFHTPNPELLLMPPEQFIGRAYAETLPTAIVVRLDAVLADMSADGIPKQMEYTLDLPDGTRHFNASVNLLAGGDANALGFIVLVRDMTERVRTEQALSESETRYRELFANSRVVMLVIDPADGSIVDANNKACTYYGYDLATLRGMKIWQINTLSHEQVVQEMARAKARQVDVFQFQHRLASGELRDVEVASGPLEISGRKLLYSIVQDVTERRRYEERMRQAMVVFKASSQGIMTTDAAGVINSVNPAFCAITGYAPGEVIGQKSSMFKSGRHDAAFFQEMWTRLTVDGAWEGEIWNRRKNGETYPQWLTITAVRGVEGEVAEYVSLFSDITERKQQEVAIWQQANFDPLTGLANRSLLQDRLDRALAQARRHGSKLGLMFLDLDGFKWINDSLGHDVGDQLLIDVAHRLNACVREQDTVARLGGDEFTVVVQDLENSEDLRGVAEKLICALREPFMLGASRHHISGSIGITVFPDDGDNVQALLRNADIAMYKAKQAGKNRAQFYAPHMQTDALERMELEADLRDAIEQQAFVLHYQPIVDAAGGALVGAEALIRWCHPQRGMVQPIEFIPVAEDSGLIVQIGEWALREAVRQIREWRAKGFPLIRMAVNVSGVQFREPGLVELLRGLLLDCGGDCEHLMLEITESVLMDGSEDAEARMREIKGHGVGYSLDDFGTGFSSLSYLKRFPVDIVKIDRSFVRDCPDDRNDASLVEAIINMARSLGLRVTAEGVESVEQREFLRALGCDYLQGYLIGKPMAADAFEALMTPLREFGAEDPVPHPS